MVPTRSLELLEAWRKQWRCQSAVEDSGRSEVAMLEWFFLLTSRRARSHRNQGAVLKLQRKGGLNYDENQCGSRGDPNCKE